MLRPLMQISIDYMSGVFISGVNDCPSCVLMVCVANVQIQARGFFFIFSFLFIFPYTYFCFSLFCPS